MKTDTQIFESMIKYEIGVRFAFEGDVWVAKVFIKNKFHEADGDTPQNAILNLIAETKGLK